MKNSIPTEDPEWKSKCAAWARGRESFEVRNVRMFKDRLHLVRLACTYKLRATRAGDKVILTPEESRN